MIRTQGTKGTLNQLSIPLQMTIAAYKHPNAAVECNELSIRIDRQQVFGSTSNC